MKDLAQFGGGTLTADDLGRIEAETGVVLPPRLASFLMSQPLIGLTFLLDEEDDESELGAEFTWMTPEQMIDEATAAYPGIAAVAGGFLPVGICLEGSGDPYFLRLEDEAIVRIPHEAAIDEKLALEQVELVAWSVSSLVDVAEVSGPESR